MKEIYLDNAAAAPIDKRVVAAMVKAFKLEGNPSSFNDAGRRAQAELARARKIIAKFIHSREGEVVFCASGSEANALAILGAASALSDHHRMVTTPIEHLSVLEPARRLERAGWRVEFLGVDEDGEVKPEAVIAALDKNTAIVSVMYANNEIGTIQDIARTGREIIAWRKRNQTNLPLFHVDACQAAGYLDLDVQRLGVDLMTFNGSKIYGPRGVAALYVRRGIQLESLILGGSQEFGLRAGTENVPAISGLAKAVELVNKKDADKVVKLRDHFISKLGGAIPSAHINGPLGKKRLANNINISIPDTDSENLLLELDSHGIRAGSGSACTAHAVEPSHVLKAIGTRGEYLDGVLRISLSRNTTRKDIDLLLKVLPEVVAKVKRRHSRS